MLRVLQESYLQDNTSHLSISEWATLMAFLCAYIPDPRFADYGKVELVFSEGPERIPGRSPNLLLFFFSFFFFSKCKGGLVCTKEFSQLRCPIGTWSAVIGESGQQVLGNLGHLEKKTL